MSLKSKAKAAKQREHNKKLRQQEVAKLERKAEELKTRSSGFARTGRTAQHVASFNASKIPTYKPRDDTPVSHSPDRFRHPEAKPVERLSDEMAAREQAAKDDYRTRIQSRVGPAFNKGGLQYLGDADLIEQQGGGGRRRS